MTLADELMAKVTPIPAKHARSSREYQASYYLRVKKPKLMEAKRAGRDDAKMLADIYEQFLGRP